jgi:hypothetical protein
MGSADTISILYVRATAKTRIVARAARCAKAAQIVRGPPIRVTARYTKYVPSPDTTENAYAMKTFGWLAKTAANAVSQRSESENR